MKREWIAFACAVARLAAMPISINALACKLGRTLAEEHRAQALLYLCVDVILWATIFGLWLLEGKGT